MMVENKKKRRKNKPGAGRPVMQEANKKDYAGLPKELVKWFDGYALEHGISRNAAIRRAGEWFRTATEAGKEPKVLEVSVPNNS